MKKKYEAPDIYVEDFALDSIAGNLCCCIISGCDFIPTEGPGFPE